MKTKRIIVLVCVAVCMSLHCKKEQERPFLSISSAVGDVTIISNTTKRIPRAGEEITQGDIVTTGKASMVDIIYSSKGLIRISENSHVKVAILVHDDKKENSQLTMEKGKVFVTLSKLMKNSNFEVRSNTAVAAIRGTSIRVTADENNARIDVLKGKVSVKPVKEGRVIEEAESIIGTNNTVELDIKKVNEIVEKKEKIEVVLLKDEEISVIQQEIQGIQSIEGIQHLAPEVQKETKEIIQGVKEIDTSAEEEKKAKLEQQKRIEEMKREQQRRAQLERTRLEEKQRAEAAAEAQKRRTEAEQRAREEAQRAVQAESRKTPAKKGGKDEKGIPMIPNL